MREAAGAAEPLGTEPRHEAAPAWPPPSIGWLEVALPLWSRRWWLLASAALLGGAAFYASLHRPLVFIGQASFVVTSVQRPSSAVGGLPQALTLIAPGGSSAIDLHVAMLRSRTVGDRLVERFDLARAWNLRDPASARALLARRMDVIPARREGVVTVEVSDFHPQRAAAVANQSIVELQRLLREFALAEASQRREFFEEQLARARDELEAAQQRLRASGFDRAALRAEPGAAASAYARQQADIKAAEVRLAQLRRIRAEGSPEVQLAQAELSALRRQLAQLERPREEGDGSFVARVRELRYAEQLVDSLTRQLEAARFDQDADPVPVQVLDSAEPTLTPASPNPLLWLAGGTIAGFLLQAVWSLARHRARLTRTDPVYQQRLAQVKSVLPQRRPGWFQRWRAHRARKADPPVLQGASGANGVTPDAREAA